MELKPKFKVGDRVLMLQHGDWKSAAVATISREGRQRTRYDGYEFIQYVITFDVRQSDWTDEAIGHRIEYTGTTVMEEFLRACDDLGQSRPPS